MTLGGRISGARLARLLGEWRKRGARQGSADLAAAIRLLVLQGQLPAGTRLPSERELTEALPVSRTTITTALDQLREEGVVESKRGAGSWIRVLPQSSGGIAGGWDGGIDLARAVPSAVPGTLAAVDAACARMPEHLATHGIHEHGLLTLRQRIAERYVARGVATSPDQIVVTNGAQHAFALILRMLIGPGDRVLVEEPTYPNALEAIRSASGIPVPVPMTPDGWDIEAWDAALRQVGPRLAYVIPDFHNPTGHRLAADGRSQLASALRRSRTPTVVDETLVELDLDGDPLDGPPPMAAFVDDLVLTVGSASKSYWGGLRVGWIRASEELVQRLLSMRTSIDLGTPVFEQLVLEELLVTPRSIMQQRSEELTVQRDVAVSALREHCPQWSLTVPSGGLSLWCDIGVPASTRIAVVAQNHGLRLVPGPRFAVHGGCERMLRVPYTLSTEKLREALRRLGVVADSVVGTGIPLDAEVDVPVA